MTTYFRTRSIIFVGGIMACFSAGCIRGTHTFSSALVPTTQYVSIGSSLAPDFDILSASNDRWSHAEMRTEGENGQIVRLQSGGNCATQGR